MWSRSLRAVSYTHLDQGGDGGTRQNPQEGIGESDEELLEFGQILKTGDRALHRVHADKEKALSLIHI